MRRFTFFWCIYILGLFTVADVLLAAEVSAKLDIRCCRCSFLDWCICTTLIFTVADTLLGTNVSATCFSLSLQMIFSLPIMYNCIYILSFLRFEDAFFANFSSTSHIIDNMRMLLIEIMHPQLALSITCRYSPSKFCIFNPRKSTTADAFPTKIISTTLSQQSSAPLFIKHTITYWEKILDMNFCEYKGSDWKY